jgi:predicted nucleic acid-binding protein
VLPIETAFREAERLLAAYAAAHALRPPDALQLASALLEHAVSPLDSFLTTDTTLARLAALEGLTVKP